jgi:hypothetical protein
VLLGLLALLACVLFAVRTPPLATSRALALKLVGYTNLPGDDLRFALFSVSNQAPYAIRWWGDWVEVEGIEYRKGRIVNTNLPGWTYDPVLRAGESMQLAIGEPLESARWRFTMTYSRYSVQERLFDLSWRYRLPLQIGPLVLVDGQRILNRTNHVVVSTEWLTK